MARAGTFIAKLKEKHPGKDPGDAVFEEYLRCGSLNGVAWEYRVAINAVRNLMTKNHRHNASTKKWERVAR